MRTALSFWCKSSWLWDETLNEIELSFESNQYIFMNINESKSYYSFNRVGAKKSWYIFLIQIMACNPMSYHIMFILAFAIIYSHIRKKYRPHHIISYYVKFVKNKMLLFFYWRFDRKGTLISFFIFEESTIFVSKQLSYQTVLIKTHIEMFVSKEEAKLKKKLEMNELQKREVCRVWRTRRCW